MSAAPSFSKGWAETGSKRPSSMRICITTRSAASTSAIEQSPCFTPASNPFMNVPPLSIWSPPLVIASHEASAAVLTKW